MHPFIHLSIGFWLYTALQCRNSMSSNCLVFHTSGGISFSPAAFLFLIFLRTESSSSCVNGPSLMSNCLLIILVNRSTTSQILTIRRILEGVRAKNLQATLIFVDFTKAFDSIHRGKMEQILLAYGIPKETVATITILYRNTKVKVRSPDGDTEYFDIIAGVLQGDTLAPYLFIIFLDYVLRTSIDKIRENGFELTKKRSRRYPATTITDADYADDIAILANTPDQAETLLHSLERAATSIGLYVNAHKTEYMCYNQTGDISTLVATPLKLVDKFTYLRSTVESTKKDIETRLTKAWTAINRLSITWKSDLTDKMKRSFFQAAVTSILLYGCTTWTLTKRLEKKLDGNHTRMLRAILNKSWRQHPTRHQLYGHLPPITKTIQVRQTRHAGHCWRSRDELIRDVLLWTPTHGRARAGRPARTYIQLLCEDTGCCPEDLPRAMNDREEWRERVRDIGATSARWWWWWWNIRTVSLSKTFLLQAIQINQTIQFSISTPCPVGWGCRIDWLLPCRGVRQPNECPWYYTKQYDGEVPVMLEIWGMQSTHSLPSLPGPLWPRVVAPDRALSMG